MDSVGTITGNNLYYLFVGDVNPSLQPKVDSLIKQINSNRFSLVKREGNVLLYKTDARTLQQLKQFYKKELDMND